MRLGLPDHVGITKMVLLIAIAPAALLVLGRATGGVLGLASYFLLATFIVVWDVYAVLRTLGARASPLGALISPENATVVSCNVVVMAVWCALAVYLWESHRAWYAVGYALAAVATAVLLLRSPATRRVRNGLILAYDVVGALALAAWAACDWNVDAGALPHAAAQSWGMLQSLLFDGSALLAPIFILPPLLVIEPRPPREHEGEGGGKAGGVGAEARPRGSARPAHARPTWRHVASWGLDASLGAVTVVLVLLLPVCLGNVVGWRNDSPPPDADIEPDDGFEFAALGRAFTEVARPPDDWRDIVAEEVARANELGLDHIRYDLLHELLENTSSLERLDQAIKEIRAAGLDVMLGLLGSGRWEDEHPTYGEMVDVIMADTDLVVGRWTPAWVCPFVEPNGRLAAALGRSAPVEDWAATVDALGESVRSRSGTRVMVEVAVKGAAGGGQGPELVEALSGPGMSIDAIGLSLTTLRPGDLDAVLELGNAVRNGSLGLWVSTFGAEATMLGERAQARALSAAAMLATERLPGTGLCVRSLMDDTPLPNGFGLVGRDGTPREAFFALRDAIREVHWNG